MSDRVMRGQTVHLSYLICFYFKKLSSFLFVILSFLSYFFFHFSVSSSLVVFYIFLSIVPPSFSFPEQTSGEDSDSLLEKKQER